MIFECAAPKCEQCGELAHVYEDWIWLCLNCNENKENLEKDRMRSEGGQ